MNMTSAQAAKELKTLKDQFDALEALENKSKEFIRAFNRHLCWQDYRKKITVDDVRILLTID